MGEFGSKEKLANVSAGDGANWGILTDSSPSEKVKFDGAEPNTAPGESGIISSESSAENFTESELARIAKTVGRVPDDPEVIRLNLVLRYQKFTQLKNLCESQKQRGILIQQGTLEDFATAKRELREAMELTGPFRSIAENEKRSEAKFATRVEREKEDFRRSILTHQATGRDRGEGFFLKEQEIRSRIESERKAQADSYATQRAAAEDNLLSKMPEMIKKFEQSEIYQTYVLYKDENPEDPISKRRAGTDGIYHADHSLNFDLFEHPEKPAAQVPEPSDAELPSDGEPVVKPTATGVNVDLKSGPQDTKVQILDANGLRTKEYLETEQGKKEQAIEAAFDSATEGLDRLSAAGLIGSALAKKFQEILLNKAALEIEAVRSGLGATAASSEVSDAEKELERLKAEEEARKKQEEEERKKHEAEEAEKLAIEKAHARILEIDRRISEIEHRPLTAVNADFTYDKKELASVLAERDLRLETEKANLIKRLWKGKLFKNYFENKYAREYLSGLREIETEGGETSLSSLIRSSSQETIARFVQGATADMAYLHAKGKNGEKLEREDSEFEQQIRGAIADFASKKLGEFESLADLERTFKKRMDEIAKTYGNKRSRRTEIDNYLEVATMARRRVEHGIALGTVMGGFKAYHAEIRSKSVSETYLSSVDQLFAAVEEGKLNVIKPETAPVTAESTAKPAVPESASAQATKTETVKTQAEYNEAVAEAKAKVARTKINRYTSDVIGETGLGFMTELGKYNDERDGDRFGNWWLNLGEDAKNAVKRYYAENLGSTDELLKDRGEPLRYWLSQNGEI